MLPRYPNNRSEKFGMIHVSVLCGEFTHDTNASPHGTSAVSANFPTFALFRNGVKITSQFDAILLPSSIPSFSLNSAAIRLKR